MDCSGSLDVASTFVEGFHSKQRIEDGLSFPKILTPQSAQHAGVDDLVRSIASSRRWLNEELHRHSAILFRGFSIRTAQDFAAVSKSFGWESMEYRGLGTRSEVLTGVYTANEGPLDNEIWLHHEMAQGRTFPSKILFFCEIEPSVGGETPIVLSHKAAEKFQTHFPAFMEELEKHGVLSTSYLTSQDDQSSVVGRGWQTLLNTTDEKEAEKRMADMGGRIEWQPNKTAKIIMGPTQPARSFRKDGRKVWFQNIASISKEKNATTTYGNGSELPTEALKGCYRILQELKVEIPWRQGDVLVVDNLAVMHGRRPAKPPRRILVSLYK